MPKTPEELKKIINEQEAALIIKQKQQQLTSMEQEEFNKLKDRLFDEGEELPSVEQLQKLYTPPNKSYKAESISDETAAKIFANFEKEFGKKNIQNNSLYFPDDKENSKANDFFSRQAAQGHEFLFKQSGYDNYAFSDGKGHYKMGSQAEIITYCNNNSLKPPFESNSKLAREHDTPSPSMS